MKKDKIKEKEVYKTASYNIEFTIFKDGSSHLKRTTQGFSPLELLGLLDLTRGEIVKQIQGEIKPDIIERQVIIDKVGE